MNLELIASIVIGLMVITVLTIVILRRLPKKLKTDMYGEQWKKIQGYCKDKSQWPEVLVEADALLDMALKRRKYKGKSMGERMVSAQRIFTNNDAMWFAHNLYKKVNADPTTRLKEADMKSALMGYRQALRDLGALADGQSRDT